MDNILDIIPDAKGGQLKFRVDTIPCFKACDVEKNLCDDSELVDIFLAPDGELIGFARSQNLTDFNTANLWYGRPKGYGMVLWVSPNGMSVIWSAYIGDEGYFKE